MNDGLEEYRNEVIQGDSIEIMDEMPEESVDLVFADPPYNLQIPDKKLKRWTGSEVHGVEEEWDKFESFSAYDKFTVKWLEVAKRVMKPTASFWVIGSYHNIYRVGKLMHDLGFWMLNNVIWFKSNPMPNFLGVRFTNATETLIWAVKDKDMKDYTFKKELAKEFGMQNNGSNVWKIPLCRGKERLKNEERDKLHPTQKPEKLLRNVILITSNKEDTILDPFAGTGTTGAVAKRYQRNWIMIEKRKRYCEAMKERIEKVTPKKESQIQKKVKSLEEYGA